jgi:hypothetical protein
LATRWISTYLTLARKSLTQGRWGGGAGDEPASGPRSLEEGDAEIPHPAAHLGSGSAARQPPASSLFSVRARYVCAHFCDPPKVTFSNPFTERVS